MDTQGNKICKECGRLLPIEVFKLNPKVKSHDGRVCTCNECTNAKRKRTHDKKVEAEQEAKLRKELSEFQPRELIAELRRRGYRGELTFQQSIKL